MADIVRLVDSIAASPTTRLDINDEVKWWVRSFNAPPPRLRRAVSENGMRDGINVSSSLYSARLLTIEIDLKTTTQDDNATELQKLARELDRADNFLMYQPTGATKPVFFRLYRSDMSQIEQLTGSSAFRRPTIELLAEPFALGLRETLGPFTVNNDPAAGSNGLYFDVTPVLGDVASPPIITIDDSASAGLMKSARMAVRQHGTPSSLVFFKQAESTTLGTDTTNPGGGPDAAMSGAGTNNYVRTSFATATMVTRLTAVFAATAENAGRFRVLAAVRRSDNTSAITVRTSINNVGSVTVGATITTALTTSRVLLDLGVIDASSGSPTRAGGVGPAVQPAINLAIQAARTSGTGTIDWDYIAIIPADEAAVTWTNPTGFSALAIADAVTGGLYQCASAGVPFGATPSFGAAIPSAGGLPSLAPNQTNRLYLLTTDTSGIHGKTYTLAVTVDYYPRYQFVRPSAT